MAAYCCPNDDKARRDSLQPTANRQARKNPRPRKQASAEGSTQGGNQNTDRPQASIEVRKQSTNEHGAQPKMRMHEAVLETLLKREAVNEAVSAVHISVTSMGAHQYAHAMHWLHLHHSPF